MSFSIKAHEPDRSLKINTMRGIVIFSILLLIGALYSGLVYFGVVPAGIGTVANSGTMAFCLGISGLALLAVPLTSLIGSHSSKKTS